MAWAILDTNIYIGHWERSLYGETLAVIRRGFIIRHSAVVLSELRRGARTRDAERLVEALGRMARSPWAPTGADWWEAGGLIRAIGAARGWNSDKRRDVQNDALIALTARRFGATVVTADRGDFELLARRLGIQLFVV